jgi:hypothetical protein
MNSATNTPRMPWPVLASLLLQGGTLVWALAVILTKPDPRITFGVVFTFVFTACLLLGMALRRNWARVTLVGLAVLDSATHRWIEWITERDAAALHASRPIMH